MYRLKEVTIKGYKSIAFDEPVKLRFNDDVIVLLGANGAGKSNIISFFQLLSYMMSGSLQLFVEQAGTNQVFLHYGSKKTPSLYGELRCAVRRVEICMWSSGFVCFTRFRHSVILLLFHKDVCADGCVEV